MPETRSMASQSTNGVDTPALASAIGTIEDDKKVLVQPKRPIDTDARGQWVADKTALQENKSSIAAGASLPGADPELQSLLHNSPFLYLGSPMTPYEWFKFAVMMPMFLTRCCITSICMPFVWCVVMVITWGIKRNEPIVGWRKAFIRPFLKFWAHMCLRIGFNYWPNAIGMENVQKAKDCRAMLIFNHVSYADGIILGAHFLPCGLAKASIADIPFFGTFTRACSFLFVERKGSGDISQTTETSKGHTTELIHERCEDPRFPILAISPEGTTKRSECLLSFSTGAFVGGRAVLPILLHYRSRYNDNGWGRVQSSLWHFIRLQTQFINLVDVEVLPPYIPSDQEKRDPRLYADNVRRMMAERLGVPLVEQGLKQQQELKRRGCCVDWTGRHIITSRKPSVKTRHRRATSTT